MRLMNIIIILFLSVFTYGQGKPMGKYINDALNEKNYIIFNPDSTFKFRYSVCLTHDIACGKFEMHNDTIFLHYITDMRDTCCNKEIDADFHYDSTLAYIRPEKLFYNNERLYTFEEGKINNTAILNTKPPRSWGYHRRFILFGPYIKHDIYYMITETQVKWKK
jgi:hypothetical protein